jgi:hypothetical protein
MLENLTFTGRELLLAVVLASVVYLLEVWLFSRRTKLRTTLTQENRLAVLEAEIAALKQRMASFEERPPTGSAFDEDASRYADANRMAREGLPAQELAEKLGISHSEAELIIALQRAEGGSA